MKLTSPEFGSGSPIPARFTADGANVSPPLSVTGVPTHADELVVIMDDPDAPRETPFVHWVLYRIPAETTLIPEAVPRRDTVSEPLGAVQGQNDFRERTYGYRGPAPPRGHGVHHYHFRVYALDASLSLGPGATKDTLLSAMRGHIIEEAELVGTYVRA